MIRSRALFFSRCYHIYEEASKTSSWLYSAQLVACLAHVAVIASLLRKTLLDNRTISFHIFIEIKTVTKEEMTYA